MGSVAYTVLAFAFVLGAMIFIHELGHFLVAKGLRIRVDTFSLGFGPRLAGFRRGGTDYRVSAVPLGGYVKMAGEQYGEGLTGAPHEFLSRPKWQRLLVALAGPLMNLVLAVVLSAVNFMYGVQVPQYMKAAGVIGLVQPDSPAHRAGLRYKDRIIAIDGKRTPTWHDIQLAIGTSPNQTLHLLIEREEKTIEAKITTTSLPDMEIGNAGIGPYVEAGVEKVEPGSPADKAGLRKGDEIIWVRAGEHQASGWNMRELVSQREGSALNFTIRRKDQILERTITPQKIAGETRIGVMLSPKVSFVTEKYPIGQAFLQSFHQNYRLTLLTLDVAKKIITGKASLRAMSGPIDIAKYSGEAARSGLVALLGFMALISLQLGIFNLFPIPILDGGVIFLLLIEGVIRRDISAEVKEKIVQIGFVFLVLLMAVVIVNDLSKNIPFLRVFK
ncbi:MAG: RIP metalloprotease RseP [Acidobacteria bacterium]|nr:RIP metalloprotease RseP [Acidobacteriota bacterium]